MGLYRYSVRTYVCTEGRSWVRYRQKLDGVPRTRRSGMQLASRSVRNHNVRCRYGRTYPMSHTTTRRGLRAAKAQKRDIPIHRRSRRRLERLEGLEADVFRRKAAKLIETLPWLMDVVDTSVIRTDVRTYPCPMGGQYPPPPTPSVRSEHPLRRRGCLSPVRYYHRSNIFSG